jgi:hypothetical protein
VFKFPLAELGLCPDERSGAFIVRTDNNTDVIFQLQDGCAGRARKGVFLQGREPLLDLIEP